MGAHTTSYTNHQTKMIFSGSSSWFSPKHILADFEDNGKNSNPQSPVSEFNRENSEKSIFGKIRQSLRRKSITPHGSGKKHKQHQITNAESSNQGISLNPFIINENCTTIDNENYAEVSINDSGLEKSLVDQNSTQNMSLLDDESNNGFESVFSRRGLITKEISHSTLV